MKNILITGGAGFIGSSLIDSLLKNSNISITCIDNFDNFYDPEIKKSNIKNHLTKSNFKIIFGDILNLAEIKKELSVHYDAIIHLAAKVGVLPSLKDSKKYTEVNILGTQNMLGLAKELECKKFILASSSSVYGVNPHVPWSENDRVLNPISPYAATKVCGELLGHVYSHLYGFQFIGLRFFAVYGPRQRPDLAIHKFTKLILAGKPIPMYGKGETKRDYTYIDDIVSGIESALEFTSSQYEIINLGNNIPVELRHLISLLEDILRKKAIIEEFPVQPGDVPITYANITKAKKLLGYHPKTDLKTGISRFTDWLKKNDTYK